MSPGIRAVPRLDVALWLTYSCPTKWHLTGDECTRPGAQLAAGISKT